MSIKVISTARNIGLMPSPLPDDAWHVSLAIWMSPEVAYEVGQKLCAQAVELGCTAPTVPVAGEGSTIDEGSTATMAEICR